MEPKPPSKIILESRTRSKCYLIFCTKYRVSEYNKWMMHEELIRGPKDGETRAQAEDAAELERRKRGITEPVLYRRYEDGRY